METGYTYLVRLDMGPETDAQSFHCLLHPIAMPANDSSIKHDGGLGDVRNVLADPALEQLSLGGQLEGVHGKDVNLNSESRSFLKFADCAALGG